VRSGLSHSSGASRGGLVQSPPARRRLPRPRRSAGPIAAERQRGEEDNADPQPANGDELAHSRDSWLAVLRLQAQRFADEDHQQPGDEQYRADDGQAHGETQPSRSHRA
jgi:hypothetical protein